MLSNDPFISRTTLEFLIRPTVIGYFVRTLMLCSIVWGRSLAWCKLQTKFGGVLIAFASAAMGAHTTAFHGGLRSYAQLYQRRREGVGGVAFLRAQVRNHGVSCTLRRERFKRWRAAVSLTDCASLSAPALPFPPFIFCFFSSLSLLFFKRRIFNDFRPGERSPELLLNI